MLVILFQKQIFGIDRLTFIITAVVIGAGAGVLIIAAFVAKSRGDKAEQWKKGVWHEILKDTGIALITAALVAVLYDRTMEVRKLSDLFTLVYGSDVGEAVVDATRSAVFQRIYIRENADYIFTIRKDKSLPEGQALITFQVGYYVYSLRPYGERDYQFIQELEHYNIKGKDGDAKELPRFDYVSIGGRVYEGKELQEMVQKGRFQARDRVALNPWPRGDSNSKPRELQGVRITTRRTEIINVPGTYNVVLGELTKGNRVRVLEFPDEVEVEIKTSYTPQGLKFEKEGKHEEYHAGVLLPGHGIHLKISLKDGQTTFNSAAPTPTPAAAPTPEASVKKKPRKPTSKRTPRRSRAGRRR
jgi:hypothetical protein